jgi:hypothetical protein
VFYLVPLVRATIIEVREYRGKTVMCAYSGLIGVAKSCGIDSYERVFTGTVKSALEVGQTDKLLQLVPDEVFLGDSSEVTAIVNQGCVSAEIQTGDRWLFYLSRDPETHNLRLPHDSPSGPISEADDEISMLRQLVRAKDSGLLVGTVSIREERQDGRATTLASHRVIAREVTRGSLHSTYTSANGYFLFNLPAGSYDVIVAPEYGLHAFEGLGPMLDGSVPVKNGQCWQHDFTVTRSKKRNRVVSRQSLSSDR